MKEDCSQSYMKYLAQRSVCLSLNAYVGKLLNIQSMGLTGCVLLLPYTSLWPRVATYQESFLSC